eukprot:GABV01004067.1.p2 GENE.GABV01004067.1~~GABV01004067.1.p2  ORF type:complete len:111 (+),score=44.08 GABV01004067.1:177-509(+)
MKKGQEEENPLMLVSFENGHVAVCPVGEWDTNRLGGIQVEGPNNDTLSTTDTSNAGPTFHGFPVLVRDSSSSPPRTRVFILECQQKFWLPKRSWAHQQSTAQNATPTTTH